MLYNLIKSITSKSEDAKSILESIIEERIQEQLDFKRIEIGSMMMEDMDANGVIQLSPQQKRAQKAKQDHADAVADQDDKDGNGAESDDDSDDSDSNQDSGDDKQPPQFQKKDDSSDDEQDDSDSDDDESKDIAAKDPKAKKKNPFIKEAFARFRSSSSSGRSSLKSGGYPSSRSRRDVDRDDEGWARTAKADAEFNKKTSPYPKSNTNK
mgnify:CR=1 FL=1